MDFWTISLILLWVVTLLHILLTVALVRRVVKSPPPSGPSLPPGLPEGTAVPSSTVRVLDGEESTLDGLLDGPAVLAFVSPNCEGCAEQFPRLADCVELAGKKGIDVLVVADSEADGVRHYQSKMRGARVILAPGSASTALADLQVNALPMYYLVDGAGRITETAYTADAVAKRLGKMPSAGTGARVKG